MLINQELFDTVEQALSKNGTIENFENENGKITGRMMITLTDIPEDIEIEKNKKSIYAFECSFDFYDVSIGIVLDTKELKVLSAIMGVRSKVSMIFRVYNNTTPLKQKRFLYVE